MERSVQAHRSATPPVGGFPSACADDRMSRVRLLADLQNEARDLFGQSGETVERFLRERRDEVRRASCLFE